jgi:DNA/RNA endonuclease YhcR with UshA esterase domain
MTHSRNPLRLLAPALLLAFVSVSSLAIPANAAPQVISIAEARALPVDTVVTVDGSVTTPSGAFESSFFDVGFGLQDGSAGIYVSLQTNLGVAPRRQARVTGKLQNSFGLLILVPADPSDVVLHGAGPRVRAQWVTTGGVGESTEGRLVRVVGTITQAPASDLPYGYKFFVDDGSGELQIFVNTQTGIDLSGLTMGQTVSVTGFSSQFDTHYEIDPRFPADISVPQP